MRDDLTPFVVRSSNLITNECKNDDIMAFELIWKKDKTWIAVLTTVTTIGICTTLALALFMAVNWNIIFCSLEF